MNKRHPLRYALTAAYIVAVLLTYLLIRVLNPDQQLAALLFAIACLLIIAGASLIAIYSLIHDLRQRHRDHDHDDHDRMP